MNALLVLSILARLVAAAWGVVISRRLGEPRVLWVAVLPGLMAVRQAWTFATHDFGGVGETSLLLAELPGVAVSVLALVAIGMFGRMLSAQRELIDAVGSGEERLRIALDAADMGTWEWQVDADRITWSPRVFEIFGLDPVEGEPTYEGYLSRIHPEDREQVDRTVRASLEGDDDYHILHRILLPSGDERWIEAWGRVFRDAAGAPRRMRGTVKDVTERVGPERELARLRALLAAAIDQSPIGVIVADAPCGRIRLANRAALALRGGDSDRLIGVPGEEVAATWRVRRRDGSEARPDETPLWRAIKLGESVEGYDCSILHEDGTPRLVEVTAVPVRDQDGKIIAAVALLLDVTERERVQREREALEQQLRQSQKMEALGTLAGGIAHDFNNVLLTILGYSELLLEDLPAESESTEFVERIVAAADRAKRLVDRVLTFSQRREPLLERVAPAVALESAVEFLRAATPPSVTIDLHIADGLPQIEADLAALQQALVHLGTNGIEALADRVGSLRFELTPTVLDAAEARALGAPKPGPHVCFAVVDDGEGMSPEVLDRAFEPFFTTKGMAASSGLGLSVVHGIVASHRGAVRARSEPGVGTRIELLIPAARDPATPIEGEGASFGRGERVLLVDDEPDVAQVGSRLLARMGYQVELCQSGSAALELLRDPKREFDLVLADQVMPPPTGLELAAQTRRLRPSTPVVLTSGFPDALPPERLRAAGVVRTLRKPYGRNELAACVREVLDGSFGSRTSRDGA